MQDAQHYWFECQYSQVMREVVLKGADGVVSASGLVHDVQLWNSLDENQKFLHLFSSKLLLSLDVEKAIKQSAANLWVEGTKWYVLTRKLENQEFKKDVKDLVLGL